MPGESLAVIVHDCASAGGGADAEDTVVEARHVGAALARIGYSVETLTVGFDLSAFGQALGKLAPQLVVNLTESLGGRAHLLHVLPALLEARGVAFTGCAAASLFVTSHKMLAKQYLDATAIATPPLFEAHRPGPWIVKSVWEHSSVGLDDESVIGSSAEVAPLLERRRRRYGGAWFAERYVDGRELNVALIQSDRGPLVLPVAEIRFRDFPAGKPRIVSYAAKWHPESPEYRDTERVFLPASALAGEAGRIARACWRLFKLTGYARVDFRVDGDGRLWVLEVNANPCLSPDAGFAAALAAAGLDVDTAIRWIADDARDRAALRAADAA
jgi:D-alanine-D-alanine ligase